MWHNGKRHYEWHNVEYDYSKYHSTYVLFFRVSFCLYLYTKGHYIILLIVIMISVIMLGVIMFNVIMLNAVKLSVTMLSV